MFFENNSRKRRATLQRDVPEVKPKWHKRVTRLDSLAKVTINRTTYRTIVDAGRTTTQRGNGFRNMHNGTMEINVYVYC